MSRLRQLLVLASLIAASVFVSLLGTAAAQVEERCFGELPTIRGGDGNDHLRGTRGNDVIFTGDGNDLVNGRGGRDRICGGDGDDSLNGASGNDLLDGGLGRDLVNGGSGRDQATGGPVLLMRWECLNGTWHQVTYDMSTQPATRVDDRDTGQPCLEPPPPPVDSATQLDGDVLIGGPHGDRLRAGGGHDRGLGGSGNDRMFGDSGNDVLGGGTGHDRLVAGPVFMTRWECPNGTWHLVTYDVSTTPPTEVDRIDTEQPCPPAITPAVTPTDDDGAAGGTGNDFLSGGYGNDLLAGQNGRDRLRGGAGEDQLGGGRGRDTCAEGEDTSGCP